MSSETPDCGSCSTSELQYSPSPRLAQRVLVATVMPPARVAGWLRPNGTATETSDNSKVRFPRTMFLGLRKRRTTARCCSCQKLAFISACSLNLQELPVPVSENCRRQVVGAFSVCALAAVVLFMCI